MAESQIHSELDESSIEVPTWSACEEMLIEEMPNVQFPKVPVQPESLQSRSISLSTSSACSDSENPEDSSTSDNEDVNPQPFRPRANATSIKRKKVSSG